MKQRRAFQGLLLGAASLLAVGSVGPAGGRPVPVGASEHVEEALMNTGVGMYTDPSVANQASSFTINPLMVSFGVGTLAAGGEVSGPFAMLMYATHVGGYQVDPEAGEIRATGRMRSITKIGAAVVEDIEGDFTAVAADTVAHAAAEEALHPGGDRFDVHFQTPFWNHGNAGCTHSDLVDGGCRFGGELLLGDVLIAGHRGDASGHGHGHSH
jgi:hypothetical protein